MKTGSIFLTVSIPAVILLTMYFWSEEPIKETKCNHIERIPVTATSHFEYCPELDMVRYDTTWIEPGRSERRRIKMRGL